MQENRVAEAIAIAAEMGSTGDDVLRHLRSMPAAYADAVAPRTIVRHALLLANPPEGSSFATRVSPSAGNDGIDELDVIAGDDRPGLFAKVSGVLALNGGKVIAAEAFARDDGIVVDFFQIRPPEGAGGSWWARVEGDLADAAAGRLAVRARVAAIARSEAERVARLPAITTQITIKDGVVDVSAVDRLGVLYAITSALAELEVDIVSARIASVDHAVHDRFVVRTSSGDPVDADHATEIILAVEHAIATL
ncbi:MAG: ACT domain-containing protein [Nitriliruptoraceae bacterium]